MKETKLSAGFFTTILAAGLAGAGLYMYFQNANTSYFSSLGKDPVVIGCLAAAAAVLVLSLIAGRPSPAVTDLFPVAAPILSAVALLVLANSRINGIASIMTFTNNAQNMADLKSAIIAMGLIAGSVLMGLLNAFLDVRKYK